MNIYFTVWGDPQALKRHRTYKSKSGKMINVDPSASDKADFLAQALSAKPDAPITGPIKVCINAWFRRPKSHFGTGKNSSKLKADAPGFHVKKPDIDNVLKFVLDALNGIYWIDDAQIAEVSVVKRYGGPPSVSVRIERLVEGY
jgi:Holliday junction resolvase RusA-like endonuclease